MGPTSHDSNFDEIKASRFSQSGPPPALQKELKTLFNGHNVSSNPAKLPVFSRISQQVVKEQLNRSDAASLQPLAEHHIISDQKPQSLGDRIVQIFSRLFKRSSSTQQSLASQNLFISAPTLSSSSVVDFIKRSRKEDQSIKKHSQDVAVIKEELQVLKNELSALKTPQAKSQFLQQNAEKLNYLQRLLSREFDLSGLGLTESSLNRKQLELKNAVLEQKLSLNTFLIDVAKEKVRDIGTQIDNTFLLYEQPDLFFTSQRGVESKSAEVKQFLKQIKDDLSDIQNHIQDLPEESAFKQEAAKSLKELGRAEKYMNDANQNLMQASSHLTQITPVNLFSANASTSVKTENIFKELYTTEESFHKNLDLLNQIGHGFERFLSYLNTKTLPQNLELSDVQVETFKRLQILVPKLKADQLNQFRALLEFSEKVYQTESLFLQDLKKGESLATEQEKNTHRLRALNRYDLSAFTQTFYHHTNLNQLLADPTFKAFANDFKSLIENVRTEVNSDFNSLFANVYQRAPRYSLLVGELIKSNSNGQMAPGQSALLQMAANKFKSVALNMNEA